MCNLQKCTKHTVMAVFFAYLLCNLSFAEQEGGFIEGIAKGLLVKDGKIFFYRIKNATVSLEFTKYSAHTREDGVFRIGPVPQGKYILVLDANIKGKRKKVKRNIVVTSRCTTFLGEIPVFAGTPNPPHIKEGFAISYKGKKNTLNRVIFYTNNFKAYWELGIKYSPLWICFDNTGRYLLISTHKSGIFIWNLDTLEEKNILKGYTTSCMSADPSGKKIYATIFGRGGSFFVSINPYSAKVTPLFHIKKGGGVLTSFYFDGETKVYLALARTTIGGILTLNLSTRKISNIFKTSSIPMDVICAKNILFVANYKSKNIFAYDIKKKKLKYILTVDGKPTRFALGLSSNKIYTSIPDKNKIIVIDAITCRKIREIPVGKSPFFITKQGKYIYVCNRKSANVSIIDLTKEEVIFTTPTEDMEQSHCITKVPPKRKKLFDRRNLF